MTYRSNTGATALYFFLKKTSFWSFFHLKNFRTLVWNQILVLQVDSRMLNYGNYRLALIVCTNYHVRNDVISVWICMSVYAFLRWCSVYTIAKHAQTNTYCGEAIPGVWNKPALEIFEKFYQKAVGPFNIMTVHYSEQYLNRTCLDSSYSFRLVSWFKSLNITCWSNVNLVRAFVFVN